MASKDKENMSREEFAAFQQRQYERRIRREKRAQKALRKQWKEAAKNVRVMRSYGGSFKGSYSMGPRLRRSFKEIKNGKYIKQRRGEITLRRENDQLRETNQKLRRFNDFLVNNRIQSMLNDEGEVEDEFKLVVEEAREKLRENAQEYFGDLVLKDLINDDASNPGAAKRENRRPKPDQSVFSSEEDDSGEVDRVLKLNNLSDSPYNLYK